MSSDIVFLSICNVEFRCPHCEHLHDDYKERLYDRMCRNKNFATLIICHGCAERIWVTAGMTGDYVAYKTNK